MSLSQMRGQLLWAAVVGLALRVFFVWRFPMVADDSLLYEELARNWLDHHVYGMWIGGQLVPVDLRMPGYPAFLAGISLIFGRARLAVLLAQAVLDLATCFLIALLAACLAPAPHRQRVAVAGLWLAAACPFLANYAAVPLTEVLATFFTALALLAFFWRNPAWDDVSADHSATTPGPWRSAGWHWLLGGFCVGLGTLVRPETPLLLAALGLVLAIRWRRSASWAKLARAGALLAVGLIVPLLPWAVRNWRALREVQLLAPRYAQLPGELAPRGFYAWTGTWLVRFRDVYLVPWKLETEPIRIEDLPASAFDSAEERARVAALLEQYNQTLVLSPEADTAFARLARERTARHPLRTYLRVPLGRAAVLWFTPRVELLPFSGKLWPPGQKWEEDPVDFSVTLLFGLLNFFYVGLAAAGAARLLGARGENSPSRWLLAVLVAFVLVRTALFTQVETPEPRYVLACYPAVLALAAQLGAKRSPAAPPPQGLRAERFSPSNPQ